VCLGSISPYTVIVRAVHPDKYGVSFDLPLPYFLMSSIVTFVVENIARLVIFGWDISLTVVNVLIPNRRVGHVISKGNPGAGGKWPEFIAPGEGASRSACPALNAMANHGTGSAIFCRSFVK
jgi:Peroxidase, family 2